MEMRRLRYFVRIAEDGSLTRSAAILRVAQPALSRQMRLLEQELGLTLFDRSPRGMRLTENGELLRDAVAGPFRELELALEHVRAASRQSASNVAIGLPTGLAAIIATPLALRLARDFPEAIRIIEGPTGGLSEWLARGVIDLALLEQPAQDPRLIEMPLLELELCLVGRAGDSLVATSSAIDFAEVARLPLVLPSHHLGIRAVIDAAAASAGVGLNIRFHADAARLACDLVAEGLGYALLPRFYCAGEPGAGRLAVRAIRAPMPRLAIAIASRRTRARRGLLAEIEAAVVEHLRAALGARDA